MKEITSIIRGQLNGRRYVVNTEGKQMNIIVGLKMWGKNKGKMTTYLSGNYTKKQLKYIIKAIEDRERMDIVC